MPPFVHSFFNFLHPVRMCLNAAVARQRGHNGSLPTGLASKKWKCTVGDFIDETNATPFHFQNILQLQAFPPCPLAQLPL